MRIHLLMIFMIVGASLNIAAAAPPDDHQYFPLDVGNYWIYQFSDDDGEGYITWEVIGDTTLANESYWLLTIIDSDFGNDDFRQGLCAVRVAAEPDLIIEFISLVGDVGLCTLDGVVSEAEVPASSPPINQDYWITGQEYNLSTIRTVYSPPMTHALYFASGVGLLRSSHSGTFPRRHLVYAVVGGNEFGMHPDGFDWTILSPREVGDTWLWHWQRLGWLPEEEYLIRVGIIKVLESDEKSTSYAVKYERLTASYGLVMESRTCHLRRYKWGVDVVRGPGMCREVPLGRSFNLIGTMDRRDNEQLSIVNKLSVNFGFSGDGTGLVHRWFEGIGLVEHYSWTQGGPGNRYQGRRLMLLSAKVGGVEYGNHVDWNPVYSCDVEVYPNPAQKNITVQINNVTGEDLMFGIYDMAGRRVRVGTFTGDVPSTVITQDVSGLAAGVYIVHAYTTISCTGARLVIVE